MKKIFVVLLLVVFLVPVAGFAGKKNADVTGTYEVKGYSPGLPTSGKPNYEGDLKVTSSDGAYLLTWNLDKGKETYKGVGVYADGILSVGFTGGKQGGGVVSYKVEGDTLKGVWAPISGGMFGYEIAERR